MKKVLNVLIFIGGLAITPFLGLCLIIILLSGCEQAVNIMPEADTCPKIAFSFDDNNIKTWYPSLISLKNKYPGFVATLFVSNIYNITDNEIKKYKELYDLGFEIGAHNPNHENSVDYINNFGELEFINMQIEQIDFWESHGIPISSFAYPYGAYNESTDKALKKIYSTIRYTGGNYMRYQGSQFIGGFPIDNNYSKRKELFLSSIELNTNTNNILSAYGHGIIKNNKGLGTFLNNLKLYIDLCINNNYKFITVKEINS